MRKTKQIELLKIENELLKGEKDFYKVISYDLIEDLVKAAKLNKKLENEKEISELGNEIAIGLSLDLWDKYLKQKEYSRFLFDEIMLNVQEQF